MGDLSTGAADPAHRFSAGRSVPGLLLALLLLTALGTALPAGAEDLGPVGRWTALKTQAIEKLHVLADWCTAAKLFRSRAEVYGAVLLFDPEDDRARRWLRYRRDADGAWERRPDYTAPKDRGRGRDGFETRRDRWRDWFAAEATARLADAHGAGNGRLENEIVRLAVAVAPDDEGFRRAHGEVRHEVSGTARWVLLESLTARTRRRQIREAARRSVAEAIRPADGQPTGEEVKAGVTWGPVLQGKHVRVLGVPPVEEMRKQFTFCESTWRFFYEVFGVDAPDWKAKARYGRGVTVYVLDSLEAGNAFLGRQPGVTPRDLQFVAPLVGTWIPGRPACVVKAPMSAARLEAGPKMLFSAMCRVRLGITAERAWAAEGLAHYLVYPIVGTRMIASVRDHQGRYGRPRPGAPEHDRRSPLHDDWLEAGLGLLESEARPDVRLMAGKDVNSITPDEVLYGYCLVAYLIEGRPDACVAFFREVGRARQVDLDAVALKHLGLDLTSLEARVIRWLREAAVLAADG